jgi:hypothetical protein
MRYKVIEAGYNVDHYEVEAESEEEAMQVVGTRDADYSDFSCTELKVYEIEEHYEV